MVAHSLCLLPFAQNLGVVFGCLQCGTTKGMCLSVLQSIVLPFFFDEIWRLTWMPFMRATVFCTIYHSESTAGDSFKSSTWINVSKSLIFSVSFSVVWAVPLAVIITGGTFDILNRSLFFWSLITFTHHMKWSSRFHNEFFLSFDEGTEGEDALLAGPGLKNLCRFSEYEPETLCKFV